MRVKFEINGQNMGDYSLNKIYSGRHWARRKQDAELWHWLTVSALRKAGIKKNICSSPVSITFYWGTKLDLDNTAYMRKLIIDALKGYLIRDDTQKYVVELCDKTQRVSRGITVVVEEI